MADRLTLTDEELSDLVEEPAYSDGIISAYQRLRKDFEELQTQHQAQVVTNGSIQDQLIDSESACEALAGQIEMYRNNPVPTRLLCPACGVLHLDENEWATIPHRRHQCQACKHEWRPFVVATVGVNYEIGQLKPPTREVHIPPWFGDAMTWAQSEDAQRSVQNFPPIDLAEARAKLVADQFSYPMTILPRLLDEIALWRDLVKKLWQEHDYHAEKSKKDWGRSVPTLRERIGKLTLVVGLPMEVWSELCKLQSELGE